MRPKRRLWYYQKLDYYLQTLSDMEVDTELSIHCREVTRVSEHEVRFITQLNHEGNMALFNKGKAGSKPSKGGFVYKPRSDEQLNRAATKRTGGGESAVESNIKTFNPGEGEHEIRVLPPTWDDPEHFALDVHIHYGIGSDNSSFICVKKMRNEECAACDARKEASSEGEEELAKALSPNIRAAFYMIDRKNESEGPLLWLSPYQNFHQEMLLQARDARTKSFVQLDNPEDGYDISFTVKGKGLSKKYTGIKVARSASPLSDDEDTAQAWLAYIAETPIPDALVYPEYDHVKAALEGGVRTRDEDGKEEQRGGKASANKPGFGKKKPEPEAEEAEEEEKPSKAAKPGFSKKKPEPEPEAEEATDFDPRDWDWESVHALDEEGTEELIAAAEIAEEDYADADNLEAVHDVICQRLGCKKPHKESGGKFKLDRLAQLKKARK